MDSADPVLWRPSAERIAGCALTRFAAFAADRHGAPRSTGDVDRDWRALHHWSVRDRAAFWTAVWEFAGVIGERGRAVLEDGERMPGARWFADSRLNYTENLLDGDPLQIVLIARDEAGRRRTYTRGALREEVLRVAGAFAAAGVSAGDAVAGVLANTPEALIAMLAAAHLGAVWTSTSPEFGAASVIERFAQTGARVLVACAAYQYAGQRHDCVDRIAQIARALPGLALLVVTGADADAAARLPRACTWEELRAAARGAAPLPRRMPFNAPLCVLYSSGTTGKPKAIVHGIGGTLLQHRKEHLLHTDIRARDVVFYYTTCGWMMWNWLASALACGAAVVLYDGAPVHPDEDALWRMAAEEGITVFGTSPRYLATLEKAAHRPRARHRLTALRTVLSTGAPLAPSQFDYVYDAIAPNVHLATISGGTDIVSCFCLGVPWLPVRRGEIQAPGLGMATDVFDQSGRSVVEQRGELVCTAPFPSMPLGFLGDEDGSRYREAYFSRYPGVWHHGDYAIRTRAGGFILLGRSDAVLNPGGVRIGTAEIYRQVEQLPEVLESLAIGQQTSGDERIVLFVRLRAGNVLDAALEAHIRNVIREHTSPRHVPARIVAVADLPRTLSGKLVELAVRDMVHGREVANRDALANPESLELFRDLPQLRE